MRQYLSEVTLTWQHSESAPELRQKLKEWQQENIQAETVQIAEAHGHEVIFMAPHHSDLYSIELLWALVKGNVFQKYCNGTTLEDVNCRLDDEFEMLETEIVCSQVQRIIRFCGKVVQNLKSK